MALIIIRPSYPFGTNITTSDSIIFEYSQIINKHLIYIKPEFIIDRKSLVISKRCSFYNWISRIISKSLFDCHNAYRIQLPQILKNRRHIQSIQIPDLYDSNFVFGKSNWLDTFSERYSYINIKKKWLIKRYGLVLIKFISNCLENKLTQKLWNIILHRKWTTRK